MAKTLAPKTQSPTMERKENARLLLSGIDDESNGNEAPSSYGTDQQATEPKHVDDQPAGESHVPGDASIGSDANGKPRRSWWKRERLQRHPSLDKVDEDQELQEKDMEKKKKKKRSSRDGLFGVRSYLHHFYEDHVHKDPNIYEEDDFAYLLGNPKRRRCTAVWWKVFVWIGANFLIFGIIGVLVGYLVPPKANPVDQIAPHLYIEDRSAMAFNFHLYLCKLVGLILFCIGGLTLAVALLFPSFLYHYCEDDRRDSSFKVLLGEEKPPASPLEMQIPASSLIAGVQPERKSKEAIVTKEGMVPYSE